MHQASHFVLQLTAPLLYVAGPSDAYRFKNITLRN